MLKKVSTRKVSAMGQRFAIVAAEYNRQYVDGMLKAAKRVFQQAGAESVRVIRVPGSFEIPVVAAAMAENLADPVDAVLCLGVILRGATSHADNIADAVSHGLVRIQIRTKVPVIHEVLVMDNEAQAKERCLSKDKNRGAEAAGTAIRMAWVMAKIG